MERQPAAAAEVDAHTFPNPDGHPSSKPEVRGRDDTRKRPKPLGQHHGLRLRVEALRGEVHNKQCHLAAALFVPSLRGDDEIGSAPSRPTEAFGVARATAWFFGVSYNLSGK